MAPPLGELSPQVTEGVSFIRGVSKGSLRLGRPLDNVPPARSGPRGRAKFGLPGGSPRKPAHWQAGQGALCRGVYRVVQLVGS